VGEGRIAKKEVCRHLKEKQGFSNISVTEILLRGPGSRSIARHSSEP